MSSNNYNLIMRRPEEKLFDLNARATKAIYVLKWSLNTKICHFLNRTAFTFVISTSFYLFIYYLDI